MAEPLDEAAFANAVGAVEQSYRTERHVARQILAAVERWRRRSINGDPRLARWTAIARLTAAEVNRFAAQLDARPSVATIVADLSNVDLDALGKLGRVERVRSQDLRRRR